MQGLYERLERQRPVQTYSMRELGGTKVVGDSGRLGKL